MTDIMFTRTALTEAAKEAKVTADHARTLLETTLPHLTAQDVQHVLREAWGEGWRAGAGWPQDERNPYAKEADHE